MLSRNPDDERLSKQLLALTEISNTLIYLIHFSELVGSVSRIIVVWLNGPRLIPQYFAINLLLCFESEVKKEVTEGRYDQQYPCTFGWI